jgi:hypothetical protein
MELALFASWFPSVDQTGEVRNVCGYISKIAF